MFVVNAVALEFINVTSESELTSLISRYSVLSDFKPRRFRFRLIRPAPSQPEASVVRRTHEDDVNEIDNEIDIEIDHSANVDIKRNEM